MANFLIMLLMWHLMKSMVVCLCLLKYTTWGVGCPPSPPNTILKIFMDHFTIFNSSPMLTKNGWKWLETVIDCS